MLISANVTDENIHCIYQVCSGGLEILFLTAKKLSSTVLGDVHSVIHDSASNSRACVIKPICMRHITLCGDTQEFKMSLNDS